MIDRNGYLHNYTYNSLGDLIKDKISEDLFIEILKKAIKNVVPNNEVSIKNIKLDNRKVSLDLVLSKGRFFHLENLKVSKLNVLKDTL